MKVKIIKYRELEWFEEGLSGTLNNKVYYRLNGKTFIRKVACQYDKTPSPKQAVARERFKLAQRFAATVMKDPVLRSQYVQIAAGKMTAYAKAISEYLHTH